MKQLKLSGLRLKILAKTGNVLRLMAMLPIPIIAKGEGLTKQLKLSGLSLVILAKTDNIL